MIIGIKLIWYTSAGQSIVGRLKQMDQRASEQNPRANSLPDCGKVGRHLEEGNMLACEGGDHTQEGACEDNEDRAHTEGKLRSIRQNQAARIVVISRGDGRIG